MLSKKIKFSLTDPMMKEAAIKPEPAQKNLPEWYKSMDTYIGGKFDPLGATMKKCVPVLDSLSTGYVIKTWTYILIKRDEKGGVDVSWSLDTYAKAVEGHSPEQAVGYPVPFGYDDTVLKFINPWRIKTPEGYSTMFLQPPHREDLPFKIIPGFVDTDTFPLVINFPFHLKKDFVGIIPYGTPICHVIPFKRDSFIAEYSVDEDRDFQQTMLNKHNTSFVNRYKNMWWNRKEYR
jgi:hypothetical protein